MTTLAQYLTLLPNSLSEADKIEYTQLAYEDVVKKPKLDPSIHPLKFTNHIKLDGFTFKGVMVDSLSEIAFKEIVSINNCDILDTEQDFGTVDTALFGNIEETDYGFTDFDLVNESQSTTPEIYQAASSIVCTNVSECFTLLTGYMYPYFCTTADGWYVDRHYYDIQTMVDTYTTANLIVDDVLMVLAIFQVLSRFYGKNADTNRENIYHKFGPVDLVNLHNNWKNTIGNDGYDFIGIPDGNN